MRQKKGKITKRGKSDKRGKNGKTREKRQTETIGRKDDNLILIGRSTLHVMLNQLL